MNYVTDQFSSIVDDIYNLYLKFNADCEKTVINLESNGVRTAKESVEFLDYTVNYLEKLNNIFQEDVIWILMNDFNTEIRIKNRDSLIKKLDKYKRRELLNGTSSINKCMNDLLGFRFIFDELPTEKDLKKTMSNIPGVWRCYLKNQNDYVGFHIYIKSDNLHFPWEIQIWSSNNEINNRNAHIVHEKEKLA